MLSLPSEVLRDVLLALDRWTLDDVQFTNRRFRQLILNRLSDVCLRQVASASFFGPKVNVDESSYDIYTNGPPERMIRSFHSDTDGLFTEFVQALRSSCVMLFTINRLVFTPELAACILETPIIVNDLTIFMGSYTELTPARFQEIVLYWSPTFMWLGSCHSCQISDVFVRALFDNGMLRMSFMPANEGSFGVTDDVVVDFCVRGDIGRQGDGGLGELVLYNGSFTKNLFKRLVEASTVSLRTQTLRIAVSVLRFEDVDLHDFAQYLSYRYRGQQYQMRIYDLPDEQYGAAAAMHLQIVLHEDNRLELIRAQRPNTFFYTSDE